MTESRIYWAGFEDGFADGVCTTAAFRPTEARQYSAGFYAGTQARIASLGK